MEITVSDRRRATMEYRASRRDEIQKRWNERVAIRQIEAWTTATSTLGALVENVLVMGEFANHRDLARAAAHSVYPDDQAARASLYLELASTLFRIIELKEMDYDDYLQTPEWKRHAALAKERYDGECALDATHPAVDAHHRTYKRRGREMTLDVVPLCRGCHTKFHDRRPR